MFTSLYQIPDKTKKTQGRQLLIVVTKILKVEILSIPFNEFLRILHKISSFTKKIMMNKHLSPLKEYKYKLIKETLKSTVE